MEIKIRYVHYLVLSLVGRKRKEDVGGGLETEQENVWVLG
jgi:hypothetical protein